MNPSPDESKTPLTDALCVRLMDVFRGPQSIVDTTRELIQHAQALELRLSETQEDAADFEQQFENERKQRQMEIGSQEYRGNTVSYIYDKCANYGRQFGALKMEIANLRAALDRTNPPTTPKNPDTGLPEGREGPAEGGE